MKSRSAPAIKARTDVLTFGRYKGQVVEDVLSRHPEYIVWLHEEKICKVPEDILTEAEENSEWNFINWCEMTGFSIYDVLDD